MPRTPTWLLGGVALEASICLEPWGHLTQTCTTCPFFPPLLGAYLFFTLPEISGPCLSES